MRARSRTSTRALIVGFALAIVGAVLGFSTAIGGAVDPITDFRTYPPALPAGCDSDGSGILNGLNFSAAGQSSPSLRSLAVTNGDLLTMTWTSFAAGCEGAGIGLSIKTSNATVFVESDNQFVVSWNYCGPEGPACAAPFSLTLVLPPVASVPCWQLDAHVGPPLAIVGPAGAFYGLNQARSSLISARNDGTEPCTFVPCASDAAIPAPAWSCRPVTATTPPTAPPTTPVTPPAPKPTAPCADNPAIPATDPACLPQPKPEPCATNPALPVGAPGCRPTPTTASPVPCSTNPAVPADSNECKPAPKCVAGQVLDPTTGACVVVSTTQIIAITGSESRNPLLVGGLMMLAGLAFIVAGRRPRSHRMSS